MTGAPRLGAGPLAERSAAGPLPFIGNPPDCLGTGPAQRLGAAAFPSFGTNMLLTLPVTTARFVLRS